MLLDIGVHVQKMYQIIDKKKIQQASYFNKIELCQMM